MYLFYKIYICGFRVMCRFNELSLTMGHLYKRVPNEECHGSPQLVDFCFVWPNELQFNSYNNFHTSILESSMSENMCPNVNLGVVQTTTYTLKKGHLISLIVSFS